MRSPSVKALTATFSLDAKDARLIKKLAQAANCEEDLAPLIEKCCPETRAYVQSMYSSPYRSQMWRTTVALHAMDAILGTHGVEALGGSGREGYAPPYEYLNAGDTYATTLIYKRATDTLSIGSWGDIAERHPEWE